MSKWGLPKWKITKGYIVSFLNIPYGNGTPVVVRARESLVHGEGE
jgi:hypothetical protein